MVNMTISVSSDLKDTIDRFPEINWSEVARQAWLEKARKLELLNELTSNSRASGKDIKELAALIKKGIAKWHEKS